MSRQVPARPQRGREGEREERGREGEREIGREGGISVSVAQEDIFGASYTNKRTIARTHHSALRYE